MINKRTKIMKKESNISDFTLPSAEAIFENEDLLTQTLLRVPPKSLLRFKRVCKDWRRIISNTKFVYDHYARYQNLITMFVIPYSCTSRSLESISLHGQASLVPLPFLHEFGMQDEAKILHPSNGLMLFSITPKYSNGYHGQSYIVCNSTTQKYELSCDTIHRLEYMSHACLAFDPAISPYYKVLLIRRATISGPYQIDIYFSENRSWKPVQVDEVPSLLNKLAFWNGAIHWINENNNHFKFVIADKRLIKTQMPPKPKIQNSNILYFGECGGQLLLVNYHGPYEFKVLEMKKGSCCWNVKDKVNLQLATMHLQPFQDINFFVLGFAKETHESDPVMVLLIPNKLVSYDLKRHKTNVLHNLSSYKYVVLRILCSQTRTCCLLFIENLFQLV